MIVPYLEKKRILIEEELKKFIDKNINKNYFESVIEILNRKGKRIRPLLTHLIYDCLLGKNEEINKFAIIPEIIHNGTLIVDDIEDSSELRRGEKTIHKIYGIPISVNAGNLMYFVQNKIVLNSKINKKQKYEILKSISVALEKIHLGQGMDIYWSENKIYNISLNEYIKMASYKTGALIALSLKISAILSGKKKYLKNLEKIGAMIGILFQIKDDLLNLEEGMLGKEFGEDIREGKRTFVVINTLELANKEDKEKLIKILNKKNNSKKEIVDAINIMKKYSSFIKAENYSKMLKFKIKTEISYVIKDQDKRQLFFEFLDLLDNRKK